MSQEHGGQGESGAWSVRKGEGRIRNAVRGGRMRREGAGQRKPGQGRGQGREMPGLAEHDTAHPLLLPHRMWVL